MIAPPPTQTSEPISTGLPNSCVAAARRSIGCIGGVDLDRRAEERVVADPDAAHVEHDAVEVEEHPLAELDVRAVVAEERRLHPHGVAALAEEAPAGCAAARPARLARGVECLAQIAGARSRAATRSGSSGSYISPASIFCRSLDMGELRGSPAYLHFAILIAGIQEHMRLGMRYALATA